MNRSGSISRSRRRFAVAMIVVAPCLLGNGIFCPCVSAEESSWQPRPLPLPGVPGFQRTVEPPPPAAITPPATPIIIQMPPPVEPPAMVAAEPQITRPRSDWQPPSPYASELPQLAPPPDPVAAAARTTQLAQTAIDQLRQAHWSAQRGAIQSARHSAWETLRTIASMRDDMIGGTEHARQLKLTQVAIDEAADFTGRFGRVDAAGLRRMIDAHATTVLKNVDTTQLTPARAVEAYLDHARGYLVASVGGGPIASAATMILADLEQVAPSAGLDEEATPRQVSLLASELSLMLRSAALQIDPSNPGASASLGRALLSRSLPESAIGYLHSAASQSPTRQNVEDLMRAAGLVGDFQLVSQCEHQLNANQLPSELPVQWLSRQQFAATHQQAGGPQNGPSNASPNRGLPQGNSPTTRMATRPSAPLRPTGPSMEDRIVDPSIPTSSTRSFW